LRGFFALRPCQFIVCTEWFSAAPLHEFVKSFEIGALSARGGGSVLPANRADPDASG
jgi:hypothetical protein